MNINAQGFNNMIRALKKKTGASYKDVVRGVASSVLTRSAQLTKGSSAKKITAGIDAAVPSGTTLEVDLQSSKGTGAGDVDISNAVTAVDVVTGIARGADNNQLITYTFSATTAANPFSDTRVVTFTLTD